MKKQQSRKRKAGVAVCMVLVMGLSGCSEETPEAVQEEVTVAVSAEAPQVGDLSVSGIYIGTVSPEEQVNIIPLVSGEVTEVNYEVGDYVEAGSVLVRIDDEAARLQLESARLSREGAELSANRTLGSAQVMSNLSMESNINSIQYQIDMAKKQYEAAGNSVSDAYEAKDDMQKALDKINDSIGDMEGGYDDMRRMAVAAKNLVKQDDAGVWRWVDPEASILNGKKWEDVFYTSQEEEDEAKKNLGQTGTTQTPPSNASYENVSDNHPSDGVEAEKKEERPSGSQPSAAQDPDMNGGSAGIGSSSGSPGGKGDGETAPTESGDGEQESTVPDGDADADSGDGAENRTENQNRETESREQPTEEGEETDSLSRGRSQTPEHGMYLLSDNRMEERDGPGMDEIRRHVRPWEDRRAQNLTEAGSGETRVMVVSNTTGGGDISSVTPKLPYAEYLRARELCESTNQAIRKLKDAGYSAADIGEGRMDSSVASYATQIASLRSQAATLESNIKSMDSNITSAETSRSTTADSIDFYEDNLENAQIQYGIQNGQAYEDTAAALANQIASADVGIASAQMQLDNYVLTAPVSGYIEQKNVDDYGMVSAGNPVYVISNKDSMTVTFYVSEAVRNQMAVGRPVTLERGGQSLTAAVTRVGQSVDARTGLFEIRATVENSDLANGVTVKVYAETAGTTDALLIPYDAVYYEGKQAYVYCVENDILQKTPVETGIYNEDTIEITGGLTKDSVVVNTWSSRLADGTRVHLVD